MADGVIPEDARQFLLKNIDTIAQWEGLLLLRAHADRAWDVPSLAQNLYIGEAETAVLLAMLAERQIAVVIDTDGTPAYRYQPVSQDLADIISRVAQLYKDYLIPVTRIIHSKPRPATPSRVQEFANAFRIRKD